MISEHNAQDVISALEKASRPDKVAILQRFFKTGRGQYGEGDIFIGVTNPNMRRIAKEFKDLTFTETQKLVDSPIHEIRLTGFFIVCIQYNKAKEENAKQDIINFYLKNVSRLNNWDLIDVTTYILGDFLHERPKDLLYAFAKSGDFWKQRISIMATFPFIRAGKFETTLAIAEVLLHHEHDLIHKAVGWMLREIGKRDLSVEEGFLNKHYKTMPRTMLRYSIEKFSPERRAFYMSR